MFKFKMLSRHKIDDYSKAGYMTLLNIAQSSDDLVEFNRTLEMLSSDSTVARIKARNEHIPIFNAFLRRAIQLKVAAVRKDEIPVRALQKLHDLNFTFYL